MRPPKVAHTVVTEKPQANVKRKKDSCAAVLSPLTDAENGKSPLPKGLVEAVPPTTSGGSLLPKGLEEADPPATPAAIPGPLKSPVGGKLKPPSLLPTAGGVGAEEQLTGEEYWNHKWFWYNNIELYEQRLLTLATSYPKEKVVKVVVRNCQHTFPHKFLALLGWVALILYSVDCPFVINVLLLQTIITVYFFMDKLSRSWKAVKRISAGVCRVFWNEFGNAPRDPPAFNAQDREAGRIFARDRDQLFDPG